MKMFIIQQEHGLYGLSELYVVVNAELAEQYRDSIVPDSMSVIDVMNDIPKAKQVKGYSGHESFYGTKIFGVFGDLKVARKYVEDFREFEPKTVKCAVDTAYGKQTETATVMSQWLFDKWIKDAYYPIRADGCMHEVYYIPETGIFARKTYEEQREPKSRAYCARNKWQFQKVIGEME